MNLTPGKVAITCIAVAAALPLGYGLLLDTFLLKAVEVPLPLSVGELAPVEYPVRATGAYEVVLRIRRFRDSNERLISGRGECLLGVSLNKDECNDIQPVIDVAWHLQAVDGSTISDVLGEQVRSGRVRGESDSSIGGYEFVDRPLVGFTGQGGKRYRFSLDVMSDLSALQPYEPRIAVEPAGSMTEDWLVASLFVWVPALCIGVVGLISGVVAVVVWIRERRAG